MGLQVSTLFRAPPPQPPRPAPANLDSSAASFRDYLDSIRAQGDGSEQLDQASSSRLEAKRAPVSKPDDRAQRTDSAKGERPSESDQLKKPDSDVAPDQTDHATNKDESARNTAAALQAIAPAVQPEQNQQADASVLAPTGSTTPLVTVPESPAGLTTANVKTQPDSTPVATTDAPASDENFAQALRTKSLQAIQNRVESSEPAHDDAPSLSVGNAKEPKRDIRNEADSLDASGDAPDSLALRSKNVNPGTLQLPVAKTSHEESTKSDSSGRADHAPSPARVALQSSGRDVDRIGESFTDRKSLATETRAIEERNVPGVPEARSGSSDQSQSDGSETRSGGKNPGEGRSAIRNVAVRTADGDSAAAQVGRFLVAVEASTDSTAAPQSADRSTDPVGQNLQPQPQVKSQPSAGPLQYAGMVHELLNPSLDPTNTTDLASRILKTNLDGNGKHQATLQLDPPELGRLRIEIRMDDHGMALRINADNPEAAKLIESRFGELKDALAVHGLKVDRAEVVMRSPESDSRDAGAQQHNANREPTGQSHSSPFERGRGEAQHHDRPTWTGEPPAAAPGSKAWQEANIDTPAEIHRRLNAQSLNLVA